MNQTELAALIDRHNHPFEVKHNDMILWRESSEWASWYVGRDYQIRITLAIPPDGRPVLNPDNLTAEQVGVGYRLVVSEDSCNQPHEIWNGTEWIAGCQINTDFDELNSTYRLPLSIPWPEKSTQQTMNTPPKPQRKIVQICTLSANVSLDNRILYALADDGTLWFRECEQGKRWNQLPNIPQPEEDDK